MDSSFSAPFHRGTHTKWITRVLRLYQIQLQGCLPRSWGDKLIRCIFKPKSWKRNSHEEDAVKDTRH